jgi:hypothetical protein
MVSEYFIDPHEDRNWVSFTGTKDEPEDNEDDHDCEKSLNKEGQCMICGKRYHRNIKNRTWEPRR